MRRFWRLTLVQLRGMLSATGGRRNRKVARAWPTVAVVGLMAVAIAGFSGLYSYGLVVMLGEAQADLVLVVIPAVGLLVSVALGGQGAGSVVFGGKDNELLLSLPLPRTMLAGSKLAALLAENLLIMLCVVLPAGVAYATLGHPGLLFWPGLVVVAALLACIGTTLAAFVGLLLTKLRARKRGKLATNLLAMLLMTGFVVAWTAGQAGFGNLLLTDPDALRSLLATWLPPLEWGRLVLTGGSALAWLPLLAVGLVPAGLTAWLVGRSFIALTSALSSSSDGGRTADLAGLRARTPSVALVRREAQRFFGTTVYFVNTGFGLVMILLAAGYLVVVRTVPGLDMAALAMGASPAQLIGIGLAFVMTTVQTTSSSISLEGRRLWILQESPVAASTILNAKAFFNVVLAAPVLAIAALAAAVALQPSPLEAVLLFLLPLAVSALAATLGLATNLQWPNLDAPNETVAVKQGVSVLVALFGSAAVTVGASALGLAATGAAGPTSGMAVTLGVLLLAAAACYALLRTWGVRVFAELA